jgi:hypothetical protein
LPCCGWGHRVGDVPVPRLSSTGAVTIAADRTSGGSIVPLQRSPRSGIREKGIGDSARRRSGGRCGSLRFARAEATEQVNAGLKAIEKPMLASPDQQISFTDPDSRSMATSGRGSGMVGIRYWRRMPPISRPISRRKPSSRTRSCLTMSVNRRQRAN